MSRTRFPTSPPDDRTETKQERQRILGAHGHPTRENQEGLSSHVGSRIGGLSISAVLCPISKSAYCRAERLPISKMTFLYSATQLGTTARAPRCQSCCARHEENDIEKASARSATCEHCQKEINGCRLTRDERNNVHDHGRTYVCMDCKQHGLRSRNLVEYTCSRCDMKGGRTQFEKTDFERAVAETPSNV